MQLPSLNYLYQTAKTSLYRFPFTLLSAVIGVVTAIVLIETENDLADPFPLINLLLSAALGIPLFFSIAVFTANEQFGLKQKVISYSIATVFLVLIYFSLPNSDSTHNTSIPYIRYAIFNIVMHLIASFIPFVGKKDLNGFWNYNKVMFLRVFLSVVYSGFLYVGIVLALAASDYLFDIDVHEKLYPEIFIAVLGIFNTWFFVSGIPKDVNALKNVKEYPNGLKIFAQYVLLSLLALYLIILYAYTAKILILWDWPKGIVSYLIIIVAVLGILTMLLLYPYGKTKENEWIGKFSVYYYYLLIPLIFVLFFAIGIRVGDYGITINRYVIMLLGVWLTMVALYFSFRKGNIKHIPVSLAAFLLLTSFGPWGIFSVSERSQVGRLVNILEGHNLLEDEKITNEVIFNPNEFPEFISDKENTNDQALSDSLKNEVKSIMDYLDDHHGFSSLRYLYKQNIDSIINIAIDSNRYVNEAKVYMEALGFDYRYRAIENTTTAYFNTGEKDVIDVRDFDYTRDFSYNGYGIDETSRPFTIEGNTFRIKYLFDGATTLVLSSKNEEVKFDLQPMINRLMADYGSGPDHYDVPDEKMTIVVETEHIEAKFEFTHLTIDQENNTNSIRMGGGRVYIKVKSN